MLSGAVEPGEWERMRERARYVQTLQVRTVEHGGNCYWACDLGVSFPPRSRLSTFAEPATAGLRF